MIAGNLGCARDLVAVAEERCRGWVPSVVAFSYVMLWSVMRWWRRLCVDEKGRRAAARGGDQHRRGSREVLGDVSSSTWRAKPHAGAAQECALLRWRKREAGCGPSSGSSPVWPDRLLWVRASRCWAEPRFFLLNAQVGRSPSPTLVFLFPSPIPTFPRPTASLGCTPSARATPALSQCAAAVLRNRQTAPAPNPRTSFR